MESCIKNVGNDFEKDCDNDDNDNSSELKVYTYTINFFFFYNFIGCSFFRRVPLNVFYKILHCILHEAC